MSNIRERAGKFQARVTVAGRTVSKTFIRRSDAEKWGWHQRLLMERGEYIALPYPVTLAEAIDRYKREILPSKRGAAQERYLLDWWKASSLGRLPLSSIKPADVAQARDSRLRVLSTGSVRRYLDSLSAVFTAALRDWGVVHQNPVMGIRKPPPGQARDRRFRPGELERILAAATQAPDLSAIILLAMETGMRRSEILRLEWKEIDLGRRLIRLSITKNGTSRTVPLSLRAVDVLAGLRHRVDGRVFSKNGTSLSDAFKRAVARARKRYESERIAAGASKAELAADLFLTDLRFHDCRHECISRLVEGGFNLIEAAAVSGHRTMQCLKRYTHVRPTHLLGKLDGLSPADRGSGSESC